MKKTIAIILSLVMILSTFSIIATAAAQPATDDAGRTYIYDLDDLLAIDDSAENLAKDYVLGADIAISGAWTPIGTYAAPFTGTLDGYDADNDKYYTITFSDATFDDTSSFTTDDAENAKKVNTMAGGSYIGLFGATKGSVNDPVVIENLVVDGTFTIKTVSGSIGSVAGAAFGSVTMTNVMSKVNQLLYLTAGSTGKTGYVSNVGGVVGRLGRTSSSDTANTYSAVLTNVFNMGLIDFRQNTQSDKSWGGESEWRGACGSGHGGIVGLVGGNVAASLVECANFGDIMELTCYANTAGLVGAESYAAWGQSVSLQRCANYGTIIRNSSQAERVAAFMGTAYRGVDIAYCFNVGYVQASSTTLSAYAFRDAYMVGDVTMHDSFELGTTDTFGGNNGDVNRWNTNNQDYNQTNFVGASATTNEIGQKLSVGYGDTVKAKYDDMADLIMHGKLNGEENIYFTYMKGDSNTFVKNNLGVVSIDVADVEENVEYTNIENATDFAAIANDLDGSYKLMADITVGDTMIGSYTAPFTGYFDGNGHTITVKNNYTNLNSDKSLSACAYVGLFACVTDATIKNLTVKGEMNVTTVCGFIGALVGGSYGDTTIENCTTDVFMTLNLDGYAKEALKEQVKAKDWTVTNPDNAEETKTVTQYKTKASDYVSTVGGVVGGFIPDTNLRDYPVMVGCVNKGDIKVFSAADYVKASTNEYNYGGNGAYGGIVGGVADRRTNNPLATTVHLTLERCVNYGDIHVNQGAQNIAGILAMCSTKDNTFMEMTECANYGNIKRDLTISDRTAALNGYMRYGAINRCFNVGIIEETERWISYTGNSETGVGTHIDYATGAIKLTDSLTYFMGYSSGKWTYSNCFTVPSVTTFSATTTANNYGSYGGYAYDNIAASNFNVPVSVSDLNGDEIIDNLERLEAMKAAIEDNATMNAIFDISGVYNNANGDMSMAVRFKNSDDAIKAIGYQVTTEAHTATIPEGVGATVNGLTSYDAYNVRFAAIVDKLDGYYQVGYDITGTYADEEGNNKTIDFGSYETTCVYKKLNGGKDENDTNIVYEVIGGQYIMALSVTDIPVAYSNMTFTVTPWSMAEEGAEKFEYADMVCVCTPPAAN